MHIAVYHNLPSGGGKRALFEQVARLSRRHTVDVFTLSSADHDFADLRPLARRHTVFPFTLPVLFRSPWGRLNQLLRLASLRRLARLAPRIAGEIDQGGYDVALVQTCQVENSPGVLRHLRQVPTLYYCHEALRMLHEPAPFRPYARSASPGKQLLDRLDPLPGLFRSVLRRNDFRNLRAASRVLVNSEFTCRNIQAIYQVDARVCYLGVDTSLFRPLDLPRERTVFSVGSLTPLKGFGSLIEALACIPLAQRPLLVIASNFQNPLEKAYLEALAAARQVELLLHLMLPDETLVCLYNQAGVVACTSYREPFGFVPLEAMACGAPIVAVAEGGLLETIEPGVNGVLAPREPAALAQAIQSLLDQPDEARRLGQAGLRAVQQDWTWERSVERLETHLTETAARLPARQ